jgi:hypothetical protein
VWGALGAEGTFLAVYCVDVDGVGPQSGDDARGSLRGLVMHDSRMGGPRSAILGDRSLALESTDTTCPRVSGLLPPGSHGLPPTYRLEVG